MFAFEVDRKTEKPGTYPIILVSSMIACTKYGRLTKRRSVKAFLEYAISAEGQELAAEQAGSAPLSPA